LLNIKKKNHSNYVNFLCNKNFSKIIFCLKSEKNRYEKYINENSLILYDDDIDNEILIKELLDKKYDLIIVSKILTKIKKINYFLEIIKNISHKDTRLIIYNKSFLNLFIQKIFNREDFNWLNTNELKTYLENFNFTFVRKLKTKIIHIDNLFINYINIFLSFVPFIDLFASEEFTIFRRYSENNSDGKGLTICLTVKNEKPIIETLINKIPKIANKQEIIFIEGGSTDGTYEEIQRQIEKNNDKDIKLIKQKTIGQKEAIKTGFDNASHEVITLFEGDGTCDPNDLIYFYNSIANNKADYIQGTRLAYPLDSKQMPLLNKMGNIFYAVWFTWILGQRVTDVLSGIKAIDKEIYKKIVDDWEYFGTDDPFGDFELLFIVTKNCFKISEIPINYYPRPFGETKTKIFFHGFKLLKIMIKSHINFKNF
jgi:hypothetical protein